MSESKYIEIRSNKWIRTDRVVSFELNTDGILFIDTINGQVYTTAAEYTSKALKVLLDE